MWFFPAVEKSKRGDLNGERMKEKKNQLNACVIMINKCVRNYNYILNEMD